MEIRFPFGLSIKATGRSVVTVVIAVCIVAAVGYHDWKSTQQNTAMVEALAVVSYVLTLTEHERKELKLEMPDLLRERLRGFEVRRRIHEEREQKKQ